MFGSGGPEYDFTNRNTTFMTWNLLHLARMLRDAGGIPAHGNQFLDDFPSVTREQAVAALEEAGEAVLEQARPS